MQSINEARKNLVHSIGEDMKKEYFARLRDWLMFKCTKDEFDSAVRRILVTEEQIKHHNCFILAIVTKVTSNKIKSPRNTSDKGVFECADYNDYVQPSSPTMLPPSELDVRHAAAEFFMPDSGFVACRIAITAWDHGLEGAEESVNDVIVTACQMFVKNIITAMVSRLKGYKVRDKKFQYGFNQPVPDPFIRNYRNIIDESQESKVEVASDDDCFVPKCKPSMETVEQQEAFMYACSKVENKSDNVLTVKLLYDTIRDNPNILGLYSMHSVSVLKLGLNLDEG